MQSLACSQMLTISELSLAHVVDIVTKDRYSEVDFTIFYDLI